MKNVKVIEGEEGYLENRLVVSEFVIKMEKVKKKLHILSSK